VLYHPKNTATLKNYFGTQSQCKNEQCRPGHQNNMWQPTSPEREDQ